MLRTPFYKYHVEQEGKMVDFAGWEMPISYGSIHEEHKQVRNAGGIFDVSHMGRIKFSGRDARKYLEQILTRRISDMKENTCRYALVCNERGGTLDDVIVYRFASHWMLVVNASNRETILKHIKATTGDSKIKVADQTDSTAMIAVQGPRVIDQIARFSSEVPELKRYSFCEKSLLVVKLIISRTGYTGEDGVEVIMPARMTDMIIKAMLKQGGDEAQEVLKPAGLGARDTLRMEAGMPLYGHELSEEIDPIAAGLNFAVSLDKGETDADKENDVPGFIGQKALQAIAEAGPERRLVGMKLSGKRTARQGMELRFEGHVVGRITSGCVSPTLGYPIAMGYVESARQTGDMLNVAVGSKSVDAEIIDLPFYKR